MSALGDYGVVQRKMSAAVDTWHQHFLLDLGAKEFHQGNVVILLRPPGLYKSWTSRQCAIFASGVTNTEFDMGSRDRALAISTVFYWKDSTQVRKPGEADITDLEEIWDAAVWANDTLVWNPSNAPEIWPDPPTDSVAENNIAIAEVIPEQVPTQYFEELDSENRCLYMPVFTVIYKIHFDTKVA